MSAAWAVEWRSKNRLDGEQRFFMRNGLVPLVFSARSAAREYIRSKFGYIATRPDLRAEPHGWRVPSAVRVEIIVRAEWGPPSPSR